MHVNYLDNVTCVNRRVSFVHKICEIIIRGVRECKAVRTTK